jgi:hypothetical protein
LNGHTSLVAVSLSDKQEDATLSIPGPVKLLDPIEGGTLQAGGGPIKLRTRPFQVLVGRLEYPGE